MTHRTFTEAVRRRNLSELKRICVKMINIPVSETKMMKTRAKKRFYVALAFLLPVMEACDTHYDIIFRVKNLIGGEVHIEVRYRLWKTIDSLVEDVIFCIVLGETKDVYAEGGTNGKDYECRQTGMQDRNRFRPSRSSTSSPSSRCPTVPASEALGLFGS